MKLGAVENKARLAILVLILALLSLIALSLALFSRTGNQLRSSPIIVAISGACEFKSDYNFVENVMSVAAWNSVSLDLPAGEAINQDCSRRFEGNRRIVCNRLTRGSSSES